MFNYLLETLENSDLANYLYGLIMPQASAVLVSGSGVTLENSDLATVNSAVSSYATTSLEVFKLLGFIVIIWGVKYIISKVFGLFGGNSQ